MNRIFLFLLAVLFAVSGFARPPKTPFPSKVSCPLLIFTESTATPHVRRANLRGGPWLPEVLDTYGMDTVLLTKEIPEANALFGANLFNTLTGYTYELLPNNPRIFSGKIFPTHTGPHAMVYGPNDIFVWGPNGELKKTKKSPEGQRFSAGVVLPNGQLVAATSDGNFLGEHFEKQIFSHTHVQTLRLSAPPGQESSLVATSRDKMVVTSIDGEILRTLTIDEGLIDKLGLSAEHAFHFFADEIVLADNGRTALAIIEGVPKKTRGMGWHNVILVIDIKTLQVTGVFSPFDDPSIQIEGLQTYQAGEEWRAILVGTDYTNLSKRIFTFPVANPHKVESYFSPWMQKLNEGSLAATAITTDGRFLATPSQVGVVAVIDRETQTLTPYRFADPVRNRRFSEPYVTIKRLSIEQNRVGLRLRVLTSDAVHHEFEVNFN